MVRVRKIRFQPTKNTLSFLVTPESFSWFRPQKQARFWGCSPAPNQVAVVRPAPSAVSWHPRHEFSKKKKGDGPALRGLYAEIRDAGADRE
jgi:hypothetical protein